MKYNIHANIQNIIPRNPWFCMLLFPCNLIKCISSKESIGDMYQMCMIFFLSVSDHFKYSLHWECWFSFCMDVSNCSRFYRNILINELEICDKCQIKKIWVFLHGNLQLASPIIRITKALHIIKCFPDSRAAWGRYQSNISHYNRSTSEYQYWNYIKMAYLPLHCRCINQISIGHQMDDVMLATEFHCIYIFYFILFFSIVSISLPAWHSVADIYIYIYIYSTSSSIYTFMYRYICCTSHELWKQIYDYTMYTIWTVLILSVNVSACQHFGLLMF